MKPLFAALAALLLASSGCSKKPAVEEPGPTPPARLAHAQAVAIPELAALPDPAPVDVAPEPGPSPEEIAAFAAPVPK